MALVQELAGGATPGPRRLAGAPGLGAAALAAGAQDGAAAPWPHKYLDFRGLARLIGHGVQLAHEHFWLDGAPAARNAPGGGCNELLPLAWALALCLGACVAALLAWHAYLVLTAQTSMEAMRTSELAPGAKTGNGAGAGCCCGAGACASVLCCCFPSARRESLPAKRSASLPTRSPYYFGARKNWAAVFGTESFVLWALPPAWLGLAGVGDGTGPSAEPSNGCCGVGRAQPEEEALSGPAVNEVIAALTLEFASEASARAAAGFRSSAAAPLAAAAKGGAVPTDGDEEARGERGGRRVA